MRLSQYCIGHGRQWMRHRFFDRKPAAKRAMRKCKFIALACVCAAAILTFVINVIVIETAKPLIVTPEQAMDMVNEDGMADCILVLGASVFPDSPSLILADRLDKGIELFGLGASKIMLFSGDNGTVDYNEVQVMKDYALEHGKSAGLEASNIYLDYAGFSTYDSAVRCKEIFGAKRVIIVTQRYHLYRAVYNAKMAGLDVVGVAAEDTNYGQLPRDIREVPARVKDFFLSHIGFSPKIMGDPIPLVYPSTQP